MGGIVITYLYNSAGCNMLQSHKFGQPLSAIDLISMVKGSSSKSSCLCQTFTMQEGEKIAYLKLIDRLFHRRCRFP